MCCYIILIFINDRRIEEIILYNKFYKFYKCVLGGFNVINFIECYFLYLNG